MDALPDISPFQRRLEELDAQMAEPTFYGNPRRAADVTREQQKLRRLVDEHRAHEQVERELRDASALARETSGGADLRALAAAEVGALERRAGELREGVLLAMMPPEPSDSRNTVMEIRAGTGGEEAALFAAELSRCYQKYADTQGWKVEPMSSSPSERGGLREVAFLIVGTDVYKRLKWESGVHRVQRVPVTEAEQLVTNLRERGVNTTDSAVQILHKPTGLIVQCADERSQLKNKARAMTVLRSRLLKLKEDEEKAKYAAERRNQIGSGDRSERIRTYNFPQNRLTDHRIGFTLHGLPQIMEGAIGPLIDALQKAHYQERLAALEGRSYELVRPSAELG